MEKNIVLRFDVNDVLNKETAFQRLNVDEDSELYDELNTMIDEAYKIGRPCAVYKECYVDSVDAKAVMIDGIEFRGTLISEKLSGIHRVFPYIATCGTELSDFADSMDDELLKFYANNLNLNIAGAMNGITKNAVMEHSGIEKLACLNPGSLPDWPVSEQVPLFELLCGVTDEIAVSLTDSYLMLPLKSVSGIFFPSSCE